MTALTLPPNRTRLAGFLAAAALILIGTYVVAGLRPATAPTVGRGPDAAGVPLPVSLPGEAGSGATGFGGAGAWGIGSLARIDHSIEAWSKNLEADPRDFLSATNLATLYHGRGRISYDLGDHERALGAARTALEIEPTYAPARALEAAILFTLHDFTPAFETADRLVRDDPSQLGAVATRFDAALELGRLDSARADIDRLISVGGPAVAVRQARLALVTGDPGTALAFAEVALADAEADGVEDTTFYRYAVGEYARLAGETGTAGAAFQAVLDVRERDPAAMLGLARIEAFDGRVAEALTLLRTATAIVPQPEAMALLGDLQAMTHEPAAVDTYATVRFIRQLGDLQAQTFDRPLLRFELDHDGATDAILEAARASLVAQPDASGHDLVAWALYRLGRPDEAAREILAARDLGADDARLRFHAGAIELARGNEGTGRASLESALALGPALDPIERAEAARLLR